MSLAALPFLAVFAEETALSTGTAGLSARFRRPVSRRC